MTQYIPPAVYSILEVINRIITLSGSFPNLNPKWLIQADSNKSKRRQIASKEVAGSIIEEIDIEKTM